MLNIANLITFSRIALTPVVIFLMTQNLWDKAFLVFMIAALTDVLDGFVARRLNQENKFGKILDPIADKILFGSVMIVLLYAVHDQQLLFFTLSFLIAKEIILLVGGGVLWFGYQKFIQPSKLSRKVSFCEFGFMLMIMINQVDYFYVPASMMHVFVIINIALSSKLLILYARKVFIHADIA
ncbi:CDP-alcohol phosphatidyltransferase family protein [Candidatus Babeliales bacterium]|nr:CDP-alcohol phosphatidyltransferase family protein [Candidatus Babeliales bacterium]